MCDTCDGKFIGDIKTIYACAKCSNKRRKNKACLRCGGVGRLEFIHFNCPVCFRPLHEKVHISRTFLSFTHPD